MSIFEAIIVAIVEGITEFLPVSSTGHMIITQSLLGIESSEFVKTFIVNIQFGAILSVIVLYWKRFFKLKSIKIFDLEGENSLSFFARLAYYFKRTLYKFDFYWQLLIAFIPAAIIGFLANDYIDMMLESVFVVAVMLVVGGVFMLFVDQWFNKPNEQQEMTWRRSLIVGLAQCVAMIPGVSRSMASIVGGMTTKLTRKNAAEFSFFLAVPTMAAASGYKLLKLIMEPNGMAVFTGNLPTLLIGNLVAFIVAMLAIKFFINFLTKFGFKAFGYYRIVVGVLILVLLGFGVDLNII